MFYHPRASAPVKSMRFIDWFIHYPFHVQMWSYFSNILCWTDLTTYHFVVLKFSFQGFSDLRRPSWCLYQIFQNIPELPVREEHMDLSFVAPWSLAMFDENPTLVKNIKRKDCMEWMYGTFRQTQPDSILVMCRPPVHNDVVRHTRMIVLHTFSYR